MVANTYGLCLTCAPVPLPHQQYAHLENAYFIMLTFYEDIGHSVLLSFSQTLQRIFKKYSDSS
jgi:hypothetical protein